MSTNTIFYGWKRSLPGRERLSASHFEEYMGYLAGLLKERMAKWIASIPASSS